MIYLWGVINGVFLVKLENAPAAHFNSKNVLILEHIFYDVLICCLKL